MNRADGIERDRPADRKAEMSGSERVNITEDVRKYATLRFVAALGKQGNVLVSP
jgi:hypothetical protein